MPKRSKTELVAELELLGVTGLDVDAHTARELEELLRAKQAAAAAEEEPAAAAGGLYFLDADATVASVYLAPGVTISRQQGAYLEAEDVENLTAQGIALASAEEWLPQEIARLTNRQVEFGRKRAQAEEDSRQAAQARLEEMARRAPRKA